MSPIIRHGIAMPLKLVLIAVGLFFSVETQASDISAGEWVGGSDLFESPAYMHLEISINHEPRGVVNIPQWKVIKRTLLNLKINGDRLYFEISSTTGVPFIADGKFANGVIEGVISRGDKKGKFHLISIQKIPSSILSKHVGCYQIPDPKNKSIMLPHLILYSAIGHLRLVNLVDGSTMPLLPITKNKFFFAGSVMTSPVPSNTISFIEDDKGNTEKFLIHIEGLPEQYGTKVSTYRIAPLAASRTNDISFLIMQSGGGVTPAESEINQQVARMQVQKFSDSVINEAVAFMRLQFKAVNDSKQKDSLQVMIPSVKNQPWFKYAWGGLPKDHWLWKWWRPIVDFDPAPVLQKIRIPVLVIFGAEDQLVPKDSIDGIISKITDAFNKGGNNLVTVAKFEGANHDIFVKNEKNEFRIAKGYDETLKRFILKMKSSGSKSNPGK